MAILQPIVQLLILNKETIDFSKNKRAGHMSYIFFEVIRAKLQPGAYEKTWGYFRSVWTVVNQFLALKLGDLRKCFWRKYRYFV